MTEHKGVDFKKLKSALLHRIRCKDWPKFLVEWHCRQLTLVKKPPATIAEIMHNVQKHTCTSDCVCHAVESQLRAKGFEGEIPKINGHIFIIGREYEGPCKDVMRTPSMNVPAQSSKDRD